MSIFGNMFGGAPKQKPTDELDLAQSGEKKCDDTMGVAEGTPDLHFSTNAEGQILNEEEQKEIIENKKNEGWREQA